MYHICIYIYIYIYISYNIVYDKLRICKSSKIYKLYYIWRTTGRRLRTSQSKIVNTPETFATAGEHGAPSIRAAEPLKNLIASAWKNIACI